MGRLRTHAPVLCAGVVGGVLATVAFAAFRLWSDIDRSVVSRPTPIDVGRWKREPPLGWRVSW